MSAMFAIALVSCASNKRVEKKELPDYSKPTVRPTPRYASLEDALNYLGRTLSDEMHRTSDPGGYSSAAATGIQPTQTAEERTRDQAQDALDELDREIARQEGRDSSGHSVTSKEEYTRQQGDTGGSAGPGKGATVVAITDFVNADGKLSKMGRYVSEKLVTYFSATKDFNVLERNLMDRIIEEQEFQVSAMADENSTVEFGRLLGAETIVTGTISDLHDLFYINAKLVDVTQGNLLASVDVQIDRSRKLVKIYNEPLPVAKKPRIKTQVFRAQGIGIPSAKHQSNPALARAMALRAAKGDAMRNLVQQIQGVQIDADTTIKDMMTQDDTIRIQLNSTLQGARTVDQRQLPDGTVEVEMEVELTEELIDSLYAN
jgi:TolB-like protein